VSAGQAKVQIQTTFGPVEIAGLEDAARDAGVSIPGVVRAAVDLLFGLGPSITTKSRPNGPQRTVDNRRVVSASFDSPVAALLMEAAKEETKKGGTAARQRPVVIRRAVSRYLWGECPKPGEKRYGRTAVITFSGVDVAELAWIAGLRGQRSLDVVRTAVDVFLGLGGEALASQRGRPESDERGDVIRVSFRTEVAGAIEAYGSANPDEVGDARVSTEGRVARLAVSDYLWGLPPLPFTRKSQKLRVLSVYSEGGEVTLSADESLARQPLRSRVARALDKAGLTAASS